MDKTKTLFCSTLCALALGVCSHGVAKITDASALTCAPQFGPAQEYANGDQTTVAQRAGLFIEFHQSEIIGNDTLYYRFGRIGETGIVWGATKNSGVSGSWPTVAIDKDGYVLLVIADAPSKNGSMLKYRVGKIDLNGELNQSLLWAMPDLLHWDAGYRASIALNDNGVVVGVHEAGSLGVGLYYRVGSFNPGSGDYTVRWGEPEWGLWYDDGFNPRIALNNKNELVEVHQVTSEDLLHYWRGTVLGNKISWAASRRYNDNGEEPAVALLDNGVVFETHASGIETELFVNVGVLSPSNPALIDWNSWTVVATSPLRDGLSYPAIAVADEEDVVVTFSDQHKDRRKLFLKGVAGKIVCPSS